MPRNHEVYAKYENTLNNISLSNLILQLEKYQECQGIALSDNQQAMDITKHTVLKKFDFLNYKWSVSQNYAIKFSTSGPTHVIYC